MFATSGLNKYNFEKIIIIIFLFFLFFQVSIGSFLGLSARVYYFIIPLVFMFFYDRKDNYNGIVFLYYVLLVLTTIIQIPVEARPNSFWFLMVSSFVCWLVGRSVAFKYSQKEVLSWFELVAWLLILFVVIRTLVTIPELKLALHNRFLALDYFFIAPGGWNVEITFLCFLLILLRNQSVYWWLLVVTLVLEFIFQSRAGFILLSLSLIMKSGRQLRLKDFFSLLSLFFFFGFVIYFIYSLTGGIGVVDRFLDFNNELNAYYSGVGRLYTFESALLLLEEKIYGYGVGMGIDNAVMLVGSLNDANFHNIFIQIFVEGGLQCLLLLLVISYFVFYKVIKGKFENRYGCVAIAYLVSGMFQFNGYDTIGWLFIGLFYGLEKRERFERLLAN